MKYLSSGAARKIIKENGSSEEVTFLDRIYKIGISIREKYETIKPIIWADMVNKIKPEILMEHKLADIADVVIHTDTGDMSLGKHNILPLYTI